jgi:transposase
MMGRKERAFAPLPPVSLEDLVPADDFYRHLDRSLALGFVRDWARELYAERGRPSIDPVVFFRLPLILCFEGRRSERQLMRVVADRLSRRYSLGYDLTEPLPDHSSLTRIRNRSGLAVFRRFFEAIVEQCIAARLVWGKELFVDATKVAANASLDSVGPRFAVEAHLATRRQEGGPALRRGAAAVPQLPGRGRQGAGRGRGRGERRPVPRPPNDGTGPSDAGGPGAEAVRPPRRRARSRRGPLLTRPGRGRAGDPGRDRRG